jgi:MFS family permease
METESPLNSNEILIAEYEYIAQTVFQANEDRSRVTSFYFISVGSIVAAILGTTLSPGEMTNASLAFAGLFLVLTLLGALTLAQLARLRAAWHESAQAMNQIKEFYIQHWAAIEPAFKWRSQTLPPTDKPFSIANLMAVEVSLLSAVTMSVSAYFLLSVLGWINFLGWLVVLVILSLSYMILMAWYKSKLVDDR